MGVGRSYPSASSARNSGSISDKSLNNMNEWLTGLVRGEPERLFKGQCVMNVEDILGSEASESSLKHIQKTNVQGGQTPDGVIISEQRYDNFQHIVQLSQNERSAIRNET